MIDPNVRAKVERPAGVRSCRGKWLLAVSLLLLLGACRSEETSQAQAPDAARLDAEHDEPVTEAAPDTDGSTVIDGGNGMVLMPEGYAIDATEVTRAAYAAWLEAKPPADGQPKYCEWNTTFEPDAECMASEYVCKTDCDQHPQVCLDWCDAHAYCKANGKRLCGKIGGGSLPWNERPKPTLGQWINACTSHGQHEYPYGDAPALGEASTGGRCNDGSLNTENTTPVGSMPACQASGTYAGVFDLSGNVAEWIDACETYEGFLDACSEIGGSWPGGTYHAQCSSLGDSARHRVHEAIGFRCCSE
jgi:formylglycine-generating enzyme required for sulfatase activity